MQKVKVGFVGVGNFVSGNHLPNMYQNSKFEIVALCDLNDEFLSTNQKKYHPRYVSKDYMDLIEDKEIQNILRNEVLKRDVIEGDEASKAISRVKRILRKAKPAIKATPDKKEPATELVVKESGTNNERAI